MNYYIFQYMNNINYNNNLFCALNFFVELHSLQTFSLIRIKMVVTQSSGGWAAERLGVGPLSEFFIF